MRGLGTIVNGLAIIIGGVLGIFLKRFLKERYQDTIMKATGFSTIFLALAGTLSQMLVIEEGKLSIAGSMNVIISMVIGALIGEIIDIDAMFEKFGNWLKIKTGSQKDNQFVYGFVSASLTVSIGAMAIMGAIQDGIYGNHATLFAKAVLDFVIILIMASSMGKGCIFAAIPVGIFQGVITLLARAIQPVMTERALPNLSLTGSMLIFCVGINLLWEKKLKVANMLPAIVVAVICAFLGF